MLRLPTEECAVEAGVSMSEGQGARSPQEDERETLARLRLEYCQDLYNREEQRKSNLEQKSQFYLSLATILLGAVILNLEFFEKVDALISQPSSPLYLRWVIRGLIGLSIVLILITLVCVLLSIRVKTYRSPAPQDEDIMRSLFHRSHEYLKVQNFLKDIAGIFSTALEYNKRVNDRKAFWIKISNISTVCAVISVTALIFVLIYLQLAF